MLDTDGKSPHPIPLILPSVLNRGFDGVVGRGAIEIIRYKIVGSTELNITIITITYYTRT